MWKNISVAVAATVAPALACAIEGEHAYDYTVGGVASGFYMRYVDKGVRVTGQVQALDPTGNRVKIGGIWFGIANVWHPINPGSISRSPTDTAKRLPYGTLLWAAVLDPTAGVPGTTVFGSYGGHRWTKLNKLVVCVWSDPSKRTAVPNCNVSDAAYHRVHVENIALR